MELYISDHPLDYLTCGANGNCGSFRDMAGVVGLRRKFATAMMARITSMQPAAKGHFESVFFI